MLCCCVYWLKSLTEVSWSLFGNKLLASEIEKMFLSSLYIQAVQQVITNLLISHMELRSEESPDIKPYTHSRLVEKVVVSLGEDIAKIKTAYLRVCEILQN